MTRNTKERARGSAGDAGPRGASSGAMASRSAGDASERRQGSWASRNISDTMDVLSDALNKIKLYEGLGKYECTVASTKLIRSVLEVMKSHKYIKDYEEFKDGKFNKIKVSMAKKINYLGVIKPRYAVGVDDYQKFEARYIPSKDFGIIIVSTPEGIMTNREARAKKIGGRLMAYVY